MRLPGLKVGEGVAPSPSPLPQGERVVLNV
jgi:hypothetical protein